MAGMALAYTCPPYTHEYDIMQHCPNSNLFYLKDLNQIFTGHIFFVHKYNQSLSPVFDHAESVRPGTFSYMHVPLFG